MVLFRIETSTPDGCIHRLIHCSRPIQKQQQHQHHHHYWQQTLLVTANATLVLKSRGKKRRKRRIGITREGGGLCRVILTTFVWNTLGYISMYSANDIIARRPFKRIAKRPQKPLPIASQQRYLSSFLHSN